MYAVADPGFPVGGVGPLGGMDLRHGCFLAKMYAKMKELGPIRGRVPGMPPSSANGMHFKVTLKLVYLPHWEI